MTVHLMIVQSYNSPEKIEKNFALPQQSCDCNSGLGNWFTLTIIAVSCDHVIMIAPATFQQAKSIGEDGFV